MRLCNSSRWHHDPHLGLQCRPPARAPGAHKFPRAFKIGASKGQFLPPAEPAQACVAHKAVNAMVIDVSSKGCVASESVSNSIVASVRQVVNSPWQQHQALAAHRRPKSSRGTSGALTAGLEGQPFDPGRCGKSCGP